jgi:Flp pilus assembly protein TadD
VRFPGDFWVNFWLGRSSWFGENLKRPQEAVRFFTAAVTARPGSRAAHNNLGIALSRQGKMEEAIACYRLAITINPQDPKAHNNLGIALSRQGMEEAMA